MGAVIVGVAIVVGALTGAFHQGQANPEAKSFFSSNSHVLQDGSSID